MQLHFTLTIVLVLSGLIGHAQGVIGPAQIITSYADGAYSVYAADLDNDGDKDVLSAGGWSDQVAWYENLGSGDFGSIQIIYDGLGGNSHVHAEDLDNDGDIDVLCSSGDLVAWFENLGSGSFGTGLILTTSAFSAVSVYTADLDGDGYQDVLYGSFAGDQLLWQKNLGSGNFGLTQIISSDCDGPNSLHTDDIDGDGDLDVLSSSLFDNTIAWYENLGGGGFGARVIISTSVGGPEDVYSADIDGDGLPDAISASFDGKIAWYRNLGGGLFGSQEVITTLADGAWSVHADDLDGDGDQDVLSASYLDKRIAWYENIGGGLFGPRQVIDFSTRDARDVYSADLDGDGDSDVLSASSYYARIAWYENLTPANCTSLADSLSAGIAIVDRLNSVVYNPDNFGYILSGSANGGVDLFCQSVDCDGVEKWSFSALASGTKNLAEGALLKTSGEVWLAGSLTAPSSSATDGVFIKLDVNTGSEITRFYQGGAADDQYTSIAATSDGGALLGGSWQSSPNEDAWLTKLSNTGVISWSVQTDVGADERYGDAIESEGLYYAVGRKKISSVNTGLVVQYNSAGAVNWTRTEVDSTSWYDATPGYAGGVAMVGSKKISSTDQQMAIALYDSLGNTVWTVFYGDSGVVENGGSIIKYEGGYLIAGRKDDKAWIVQIDANGTLVENNTKQIDPVANNAFTEVILLPGTSQLAFSGFSGGVSATDGWLYMNYLPCPSPRDLTATPTTGFVTLSWFDNPRHLGTLVRGRKVGIGSYKSVKTTSSSITIPGLDPASIFEWKAQAKCLDDQISEQTALDTFVTPALRDFALPADFNVWPNPATQQLSVSGEGTIQIMNTMGHVVHNQFVSGSATINVSKFNPGLYLVGFSTSSLSQFEKIQIY